MAVVTIAIWLYVAVIVVRKYICPSTNAHGRGVAARPSPSTTTNSGKTTTAAATKAEDTNTRIGGQPPPTDSLKKTAGSSIAQATPISRSKVRSSVAGAAAAAGSGAPLKTPPKSYMDASMTVQSFSNPRTGQVNSGPSPLLIQHGGGGGGSGHSTSYGGGGGAISVDLTQDENSTSNSFYLSTRSPSPYPGADHQAQHQQQSQQQHQPQQAPRSNLDNPELVRRSQLQQLQPQQTPTKRVISQIQVPSSIGGVEKGRSPRSSMGQGQTYNYSKFSNVLLGSMLGEATNSEESSKTDVKRFNQHVLAQPSGFYYGNQGPRSSLPNSNLGGGGGGGSVNAGYNSQLGPGRGNADPFLAAGFKRKSMFVFNKPHSTSPVAGGGQPGADDLAAHNSQSSSTKN